MSHSAIRRVPDGKELADDLRSACESEMQAWEQIHQDPEQNQPSCILLFFRFSFTSFLYHGCQTPCFCPVDHVAESHLPIASALNHNPVFEGFTAGFKLGFTPKMITPTPLTVRVFPVWFAPYESKGRGFESRRAHKTSKSLSHKGLLVFFYPRFRP